MKRTNIRIISFFGAIVLLLSGLYIRQIKKTDKYKVILQNSYSKAMYNLGESANNISTDLNKILYITTPKTFSSYAAKVYCESEIAKESLSKLPGKSSDLETVNLFLSQVGNYVLSISKDMISGKGLTEYQTENLKMLAKTADTFAKAVEETDVTVNNAEYWGKEIENKVSKSVGSGSLASSLTELEEKMSDYPTLIYDGPYSDHILSKQPMVLQNLPVISKKQALNLAKKAIGSDQNLNLEDSQQGKIECYLFSNDSVSIAISKRGGYPVYMLKTRNIGDKKTENRDLIAKAEKYLSDQGFNNMKMTYFEMRDGLMTCNFAYLDGKTLCYTDLIKVGIASDNGEIISIETVGYLTNHTVRIFSSPKYSEEEAIESLSPGLVSESAKMVLIPTSGGGEIRCYEFKCSSEDNDLLVYINASTLECEEVFIVLTSENGTLVK